MLTRIEISGFKTFDDFALDLGPFMVVVGPNAAGKSNHFDAIQLLARLAGTDLRDAANGLRGEPHELFRQLGDGDSSRRIDLAAEVLLSPTVRDPWGSDVELTHTRVRYEVGIERRLDASGVERLFVTHEQALPIWHRDDGWRPAGQAPSADFQKTYMRYRRRPPFLETVADGDAPGFAIHHDGQSGRTRSARAAEATVLSSITSTEFPHLYALRQEMRSWRVLQLDPGMLRQPSATSAAEVMETSGANLATVLGRIQAETATDAQPAGLLGAIGADLSTVVSSAVDLRVEEDDGRREYRLSVGVGGLPRHSSNVVSDGTLRVLALLTALHDPRCGAVVCMEEPENGVHPAWLRRLLGRLRRTVSDPLGEVPDPDAPLAQVLLNSHSPVALSELTDGEMVYAELVEGGSDADADSSAARGPRTVMRPVAPHDQGALDLGVAAPSLTRFEVERLMTLDGG